MTNYLERKNIFKELKNGRFIKTRPMFLRIIKKVYSLVFSNSLPRGAPHNGPRHARAVQRQSNSSTITPVPGTLLQKNCKKKKVSRLFHSIFVHFLLLLLLLLMLLLLPVLPLRADIMKGLTRFKSLIYAK